MNTNRHEANGFAWTMEEQEQILRASEAAEQAAKEKPPDDLDDPPQVSSRTKKKAATKKKRDKAQSTAAALVAATMKYGASLFHTADERPFVRLPMDGHTETWPLRSQRFRSWLSRSYYCSTKKTPASQAIADALGVLEGMALHDGPVKDTYLRVAGHQGRLYLDLADARWQTVEIDVGGWRVIADPPVRFRRPKGVLPLPLPVNGGSLNELRPLVNVRGEDEWLLLIGWLAAALRPTGPYPVLALAGEQGTAKTSMGRFLRRLIDPSVADLRSEPRDARDLMIAANNGWLVAYDNLSVIHSWLSDALCRLSTGGGFGTRLLYSDEEEVLFSATRPTLLTSITDVVTAGDLLDRTIFLRLTPIAEASRLTEEELEARFVPLWPRILGGLLDAVSAGLRLRSTVRPARLPRMADFGLFAEAVCRGLGHKHNAFLDSVTGNRQDTDTVALESYPIAPPLLLFMEREKTWEGTASDLLEVLNKLVSDTTRKQNGWPARANHLSNQLRRVAPNLRRAGIDVDFVRDAGNRRTRTIKLSRQEESSKSSSGSSGIVRNQRGREPEWTIPDDPDDQLRASSSEDGYDVRSPWEDA